MGVIEVSFPPALAAESVAIREMDGTCIISYLHLQELKWFFSPNQNKSKERNFNCSHQVLNSIHPHESPCWQRCLSKLLVSPGRRMMGFREWGERTLGIITVAPLWEGHSQARPVKHRGWGNLALGQGCLHSGSIRNSFIKGLMRAAHTGLHTRIWKGCYESTIFLCLASLEQ